MALREYNHARESEKGRIGFNQVTVFDREVLFHHDYDQKTNRTTVYVPGFMVTEPKEVGVFHGAVVETIDSELRDAVKKKIIKKLELQMIRPHTFVFWTGKEDHTEQTTEPVRKPRFPFPD